MKTLDSDVMLSVKGVSKSFRLPREQGSSIKSMIVGMLKRRNKGYDIQHALRDISFEVKKGEFFGIVGRNGSGKSTLLKILAQIYQPTRGDVCHSGKLVPFIELGVGFNPELTGRENVYLNGALLGFSKKEIDEKYDEIVRFAELEDFMHQKLKNYSSGMQVRLAFSVATRAEADILLIDEVLAVGDQAFQRKCYDYFKSLKKSKKTIIFVSHDMAAVKEFCDRAVLIDSSRLVAEGSASQIANKYSQLFLEECVSRNGDTANNRWGDERVKYTDISIQSSVLDEASDWLNIKATFVANENLPAIVAGISISNSAGTEFCGTNTELEKSPIKHIRKGESYTVEWRYPNIFSDGRYYVTVTLHDIGGGVVSDWWVDALSLYAKRRVKSIYIVDPKVELNVTKN